MAGVVGTRQDWSVGDGMARSGEAWQVRRVSVRLDEAGTGLVKIGEQWQVGRGAVGSGLELYGLVRLGSAGVVGRVKVQKGLGGLNDPNNCRTSRRWNR